jgi:hypothetical protein
MESCATLVLPALAVIASSSLVALFTGTHLDRLLDKTRRKDQRARIGTTTRTSQGEGTVGAGGGETARDCRVRDWNG